MGAMLDGLEGGWRKKGKLAYARVVQAEYIAVAVF
jgi:hypothetical protein